MSRSLTLLWIALRHLSAILERYANAEEMQICSFLTLGNFLYAENAFAARAKTEQQRSQLCAGSGIKTETLAGDVTEWLLLLL